MEVLLILTTGCLCCLCFVLGVRVGQKVSKGEEVKLPEIDPMKAVQARRAKKEAEREKERIDAILRNIDAYDGTPNNQEDVPGG